MLPRPELGKEEKGAEVREEVARVRRMRERVSWVVWRVWDKLGRRDLRVGFFGLGLEGCSGRRA